MDSKGHIHYLGRVTVACGKVYKSALADNIQPITVRKLITVNIVSCKLAFNRQLFKSSHVYLAIKVTCVTEYSTVFHVHESFLSNNVLTACYSNKEVAHLSGVNHFHYLEAVHNSLHSLYRVNFADDNACTKTLCSHCNTLAAPAIACNNNVLACNDKVSCPVYSVPYRLTCAVSVIKKILALCIVYKHHREFELTVLVHCNKTDNARSSFLTTTDNVRYQLRVFIVDKVYKVAAVIYNNVWTYLNYLGYMSVILLVSCTVPCKNIQTVMHKTCRNIVLSRQRIASCDVHFSTTCCKDFAKISGLSFKVDRKCNFQTLKRLISLEIFLNASEQ